MVQAAATRQDIPDYLLFPDDEAFTTAGPLSSPEKFRHSIAKAWKIGLDQRGGGLAFPIRDLAPPRETAISLIFRIIEEIRDDRHPQGKLQ